MIKNIVFDFANVLLKWNQTELSQKYSNIKEEQEQIEKVIFRSKEWFDLDNGLLNYKEAKLIFKDNLPDNLSRKVDEIMDTWYTKMPVITKTHDLIKKCFFIDDGENNILTGRKLGMEGHIFDMNNFESLEKDLIKNGVSLKCFDVFKKCLTKYRIKYRIKCRINMR